MSKNKFKKFIKSLPFILTAATVVPVSLSLLSYFLSPNYHHDNWYFEGNKLRGNAYTFKLNRIDRLFRIANYSTWSNYQGGCFYNNYYFLAANNAENLVIYDMNDYQFEAVITNFDLNNSYHCNTMSFGPTFYTEGDRFPLLYVSMENADVHRTNVYRIERTPSSYKATLLQKIIFPSIAECGIYYPNSYIDFKDVVDDNGIEDGEPCLYYAGYTKNSFYKADDNKLRYFRYELPIAPNDSEEYESEVHLKDKTLEQINNKTYHELPSETATQGAFISNGFLYQPYGFNTNPSMRIIDLRDFEIAYETPLINFGFKEEYENFATYNDRIFAFGIRHLSLFEFKFSMIDAEME